MRDPVPNERLKASGEQHHEDGLHSSICHCSHVNTHEHMGVHQPELQSKKTLSQNNSGNLTLKSTSHFLQVVWPWTSYLLSLSLNFLICVIALIIKLEDRIVVRSFP